MGKYFEPEIGAAVKGVRDWWQGEGAAGPAPRDLANPLNYRARVNPNKLGMNGGNVEVEYVGPRGAAAVEPGAASVGRRPADFGLSTISDDPRLHQMWTDATRSAASSSRANGYTRYLETLGRGDTPTTPQLEEAFGAVNKRFMEAARAEGYDVAEVHHWIFNKGTFPEQIVDPRHLVPVSTRAVHEQLHRALTSDPTNIWRGPVAPEHVIDIPDFSTPLPPRVLPPEP